MVQNLTPGHPARSLFVHIYPRLKRERLRLVRKAREERREAERQRLDGLPQRGPARI
jgi:hypothetical protein